MKLAIEILKLVLSCKNLYDQTKKVTDLIIGVIEASDVIEVVGLEDLDIVFMD